MQKILLDILLEISERMNDTENIDHLLSSIVELSNEYIKARRISVMLEEKGELVIRACLGFTPSTERISLDDDSIAARVFKSGKEVLVNSGSDSGSDEYDGASSFLCAPMIAGGKTIGVINFTNKPDDFFHDNELAIARYIAAQCALAAERHYLYTQKRINDNLQIIGMLKSSVAHDIANLLGVVEVYLEILETEVAKTPQISEYFDNIYTEIKRVSCLATDMLDYSKEKLKINKNKFLISDLADDLRRHNKLLIKDTGITIEYRIKDSFHIVADRDRLFRVNFNLINNAIDALNGKGKIVFKVKRSGKYAVFMVMDNGKGIKKENLKMLFSPFFTSGKIKGTGLGLAVVDEIVKAHGGSVTVRSKEGGYTCFLIRIPIDG